MTFALLLLAAAPVNSWHDGVRARPLWLEPRLIAEPAPSAEGSQLLAQVLPEATLERDGAVRLWRVRDASQALALLEARVAGHFAPVHRDGDSTGALRVAKGGVLVVIPRGWDDARLRRWGDGQKVAVKRIAESLAWVPSAPGDAALTLAQRLDGGEVKAQPDWWTVHAPK